MHLIEFLFNYLKYKFFSHYRNLVVNLEGKESLKEFNEWIITINKNTIIEFKNI